MRPEWVEDALRDLNKQIESAQATLKEIEKDISDPYDWVYVYAFRDKLDGLIAQRDAFLKDNGSPPPESWATERARVALEKALRAQEWVERDYRERERVRREQERERVRALPDDQKPINEAKWALWRPVVSLPRSEYEVEFLEWSNKWQPCAVCRAEAAGIPLRDHPHDEGCPRRQQQCAACRARAAEKAGWRDYRHDESCPRR